MQYEIGILLILYCCFALCYGLCGLLFLGSSGKIEEFEDVDELKFIPELGVWSRRRSKEKK